MKLCSKEQIEWMQNQSNYHKSIKNAGSLDL